MATEYVIDCSALVDAFIGIDATADEVRQRVRGARLHAPHLIDAEIGQVLRGKVRAGEVSDDAAHSYLRSVRSVIVERYPLAPLTDDAWRLRDNVSFYDALYVALAARLDLPLLTTDRKLASTPTGIPCWIELVSV